MRYDYQGIRANANGSGRFPRESSLFLRVRACGPSGVGGAPVGCPSAGVAGKHHRGGREKPERAAEAEQGKVVEGLLGIDDVGVAEDSVGAADFVGDHLGIVFQQFLAGILLVVGDLGDHALKAADDGFLALAESGLVGDLIKVS